MKNDYRLFSFVHAWLSQEQVTVQTARVVAGLSTGNGVVYKEWAQKDCNVTIVNGGNSIQLLDTFTQFLKFFRWKNFYYQ